MFRYVYVDIFGIYMPGTVENILAGVVWEFQITHTWAVIALGMVAVPIMMIVLSTVLHPRAGRMANLVVASIYVLISVGNAVGESWTYYFAMAIGLELVVLATILRRAWAWPRVTNPSRGWPHTAAAVSHQG